MEKIKSFVKKNYLIVILVVLSVVLHIVTTCHLGVTYNINSDDISYINSGILFKNEHLVSMHTEYPSAQIMPGMTCLIGAMAFLFGEGKLLYAALKILWALFGIMSLIGIYKIVLLLLNKSKFKNICAFVSCLPLLMPSFLWMDNLILTETPFMCGFIYLLYYTLKESRSHSNKNFIFITLLYLFCTLLKANFAIFPLLLIVYLLLKKYDYKLLIKEVIIAAAICLLFFVPWTIRNYKLFKEFIPLTYGGGNPLLLGTYQGYGYPSDEEIETDEYLQENLDSELLSYINGNADEKMQKYYALKVDGVKAKYRMSEWWKKDKISMIISYTILKPKELLGVFYWDEIFGIKNITLQIIRIFELILFAISFILILIKKKLNVDIIFLIANALIQVAIYSYTFTFTRYGQTLMFITFLIIGYGLNIVLESSKLRKSTPKLQNVNSK